MRRRVPHVPKDEPAEETRFHTTFQEVVEVIEDDHEKLKNRDLPDQHPIGAITNLQKELGSKLDSDGALTNVEIEAILQQN